jgi:hypothetical protein
LYTLVRHSSHQAYHKLLLFWESIRMSLIIYVVMNPIQPSRGLRNFWWNGGIKMDLPLQQEIFWKYWKKFHSVLIGKSFEKRGTNCRLICSFFSLIAAMWGIVITFWSLILLYKLRDQFYYCREIYQGNELIYISFSKLVFDLMNNSVKVNKSLKVNKKSL